MEPCACADIAHRFAGERRCRPRTVAEMGGVGGRGRGGRVGAEERPEGVVPKGSWSWGLGHRAQGQGGQQGGQEGGVGVEG